jgi:hypothetical protein
VLLQLRNGFPGDRGEDIQQVGDARFLFQVVAHHKGEVAEAVSGMLIDLQERYHRFRNDEAFLNQVMKDGGIIPPCLAVASLTAWRQSQSLRIPLSGFEKPARWPSPSRKRRNS